MATRNARYWRSFLHELLLDPSAPAAYDGVCFFTLSGRVEHRDGCFRSSLAVEPLQLLSIFEQLTRQAVHEERAAQQQQPAGERPTQSLTPALRLGGDCVFHVVSASFSSVCALSSGSARGLVAQKLPFGVLVVAFSAPLRLQTVFARVDRACAALRV
ncbi:G patch domain and ankyrin repeat-containing protein 1 [Phytophthora cinnamomi]|uniref:G patch domain and ankyrin repeat-containing protein 1 n=1 Tax=Phytophthora cinnamomi TaxID=4785 RepID=UPI00355AC06D|nr:G patch domain and ankyrin repeat-containing protein 1 [Phytophthora cinnamomi]